ASGQYTSARTETATRVALTAHRRPIDEIPHCRCYRWMLYRHAGTSAANNLGETDPRDATSGTRTRARGPGLVDSHRVLGPQLRVEPQSPGACKRAISCSRAQLHNSGSARRKIEPRGGCAR